MRFFVLAGLVLWPAFALAQPEGPAGTPSPVNPEPEEPAPPEPPTSNAPGQPLPVGEGEGEGASEGMDDAEPVMDPLVQQQARAEAEARERAEEDEEEVEQSSDFMDTRLTFTCTHEDVFRDPSVLPAAPGFRCGRPNTLGVLFFDNYDTRFSGYETLSHLALYRRHDGERLVAEAGFIIRMNELAGDNIRLSDGGSYIRVAYKLAAPDDEAKDTDDERVPTLGLVAFPVSSDRMRLGYSYRISWGGSPEFFKANPDSPQSTGKNKDAVPGAKLQLDTEHAYAYVGIKSTLLLDPEINEQRAVRSYLAGAGVDITDMLRVEMNGGFFDRGKNETEDVLGEPVWLYGVSGQISVHQGMPVGSSIDYKLYRNSPESIARLFRDEAYPGGLSWAIATEGTIIGQTLKEPEETGSTTTQLGYAGDINVRVKYDYWRFKLDVMTRDVAFIIHTVPSLPTYWDFPEEYVPSPEWFAALGADRHFPGPRVTLGATAGIDRPATLVTPSAADIPGNTTRSNTVVIRDVGDRSLLPEGEAVALIWAIKTQARADFGDAFAALLDVYFQYDPNTVRYDRADPEATFNRATFANFEQLGFNITLEARF